MRIHYPTAHRALQVYMDDFRKYSGTVQVIHNICNCIEQAYGRLPPTVVESHQFLKNRSKYIKELSQAQHFSERDGGTFEDLVDGEYIMLLSEKEPPVNESQNQSNPASESLIHMKFSSPPKTVQQQRTVNIKDTIKISIKSTAMSFDKAQEEKDLRENLNALKARNLSRDARNYVKGLYSGGRSALSADRNNLESVSPPPPSDSHNSDGRGFDKRPVRRFNPRESFRPGNSRERNYRERNYRERSGSREDKRERGRSRSPVRRSPRRSRSPRSHQHPRDNYNSSYRPPVEEPLRLLPDVDHGKLLHKLDLLQRKIEDGERISRKTMEYHEKNPEKHPLYQEEWKKYWNKRYKELKAANADVTQYDFKPEWIVFWGKRMKELHLAKLEDLKMEHCRRLNLSTEEPEYSSYFKFMDQTTTIGSPRENINRERNASPPPIERRCEMPSKEKPDFQQSFSREGREEMYDGNSRDGRDGKDGRDDRIGRAARYSWDARDKKRNYQPNRPGEKESRPPRTKERRFGSPPKNSKAGDNGSDISPWDDDNGSVDSVIIVSNSRKGESVSRDSKSASIRGRDVISTEREWSFGQSSKPAKKEFSELKTDKMDINVISVLRLLTALENYLGSLGPKIVDLLAVALKMEKDKPNSSDDILLDDTYNVLFETVKEKLKGQLLAGLVEGNAVQATKTAIQYTASLLHKGTQLATTRKMIEEQEKIKSKHMPVKVEGIGKVEKAAIAKQIAAALIAQGKTSVTTEELEALVNAVVGMANAAQTTQKPAEPIGLLTKLTNPSIEKVPLLSTLKVKDFSKEAESSSTNALQMLQSAYTQKGGQAQVSPVKVPPDEPTGMEGLSDSDLKTLLQNFKDLSSDEQHGLIAYLKKLEFKEPKRVEKLRKFVNLDPEQDNPDERETSPFSSRECGNNPEGKTLVSNKAAPAPVEKVELKHKDSDDEDDYTFDEVFKSASEKVKEKQMQDELEVINKTLKETSDAKTAALDTQSIISNLMVSLKQGQGSNAAPDLVEGSVAGGCNAENIAKVLSLIGSMAGQDAPVLTPATAPAPLLPLPTQPPPPPPPLSEAVQISNQNIPANETFNQNMLNETSNFNMQAQSAMNQDHYDRNNFPESSQYPQSMRNHNPDTGFPNMLPRGNLNDFPNDFGGQPQYNEMGYAQNQAFGNGNFRPFPAGMNRGNQYPDDMRAAYGHNAVVGGNYQDMYDGDRPWNNDQHRMLPQNQYGDRLPMEEDYYNSDYDNLPLNNFRGHNRNMNRGKTGGRGKMRGRGNMDWRGGFMRN